MMIAMLLLAAGAASAPVRAEGPAMTFAKPAEVRVEDGFWSPRFDLWRTNTIPDVFGKYETRSFALRNFDRAAKGEKGGHSGAPFYDGNLLEAVRGASDYLARHPSKELDDLLDGVIDRVVAAQLPDGYLHTGVQLSDLKCRWGECGACALLLHEVYNAGCLIEAGDHHYRATGKRKLLAAAVRCANLLCDTFGPSPKRNGIPTHSLAEEALVNLARTIRADATLAEVEGVRTRPDDYLALVRFWYGNHGNNIGQPDWEKLGVVEGCRAVSRLTAVAHGPEWRPSWGDYQMDKRPLDDYASIEGHAVRAVLMCAGLAAYANETGDARCANLAKRFWASMTGRKLFVTGGVGTDPRPELQLENFGDDYSLPPDAYLETCAAVGNAFFSAEMAAMTGEGMYMDGFERVVYNALLTAVGRDGRHYTYQNPLNTAKGARWDWHDVPCCPPMFLKLTGALPGYAYARGRGGYYVNLFIGGGTTFSGGPGGTVVLSQRTGYPDDGTVAISVAPSQAAEFPLRVRIPGWARGEENPFGLYASDMRKGWKLSVNGRAVEDPTLERGYAVLNRTWRTGDVVTLELDLSPRRVVACAKVRELEGLVAELRGPVVYAEENGKLIPYRDVANEGPAPHAVWRPAPAREPEVLLEVGPSETVARASEGDLVVLGDGRWLLGYSEFPAKQKGRYAAHHDHAKARIVTRTSSDNGRTWSEPAVAAEPEDGDLNVMSVSFLRLRDGRLALFYIRKRAESDGRPVMRVSADEGRTWSAPRYCVDEAHRDYYVLNNARAVRLSTGRIVLPLCRHSVDAGDPQGFESEGRLCVAASDDDGQNWRMICEPFKVFDRLKARVTVQEPGIVELADGRLLLYARTNRRAQWGLWSSDGGATWSAAEPLPLVSPNLAPATITRLRDGNLVAVWNDYSKKPSDPDKIAFAEQREPFSIAWSKDDGRTWSPSRTIEADPPGSRPNLYCCYFAVREIGDSLYVFHCHHNGLKLSHLTKIPLAWVYASDAPERTPPVTSPALALPELSLSCPEKGNWTFRTRRVDEGASVGECEVEMTASVPSAPPKFSLGFAMPQRDIGHLWSSGGFRAPVPPNWSSTSRNASSLSSGIPVYAFTDGADGNRLTVSVSEARRRVGVSFGNREEDCMAVGTLDFFSEPEAPLTNYTVRVRLDARPVFWSDAVRDGAAWVEKRQDAAPAAVPPAAREPVYSSWYGFHQQLTDRALERECERAAALGMKTVIVDDGWQTDDTSRGYPYCGDWRPTAAKFPDMRAHVARVHALGMKYLLWYGVPLVGVKSEAYGRFRGKFLYENAGMRAAALDPRFPEVRAHLADVFERALRDWDLDGFKFDFIDAFRFDGPDPAAAEDYAGRDVKSLPEATDRLMAEVMWRLEAIKPGLLVEFRQSYVGPVVRKFGNIIRAGDCPGDFVLNRRRIADLRLTSGATAVHADMLEWHPSDTPEKAARYVLAALFSTIQYSMILGKLPPEHERMMRHYLAFASAHRATLQEGVFRPHGLAQGYPWIEAEGADERIAAVYDADTCVRVPADGKTAYVVNATSTGRVLVDLGTAPKSVRAYDVFGTPVVAPGAHAGVQSLACPEAGYVAFEFQGKR